MDIFQTTIPDVIHFKPRVFSDNRGSFFESYNLNALTNIGISNVFVQDNQSQSSKGVLRGLHFQMGKYAQAKLVRVVKGSVYDVAVDIREGSPTYGTYYGAILSEENGHQMLVPRGFAHGFVVLEDNTIFAYKCDNFYHKESEGGIMWNDPSINISWPETNFEILLSDKDAVLPALSNCQHGFKYKG